MNYLQEEDFNQKVNLGTWKRLLKYALRHKGMLFTIISSLFVSSFVDILYPLMTKYAIDNFITTKQIEGFVPYVIISVILIVIQAICSILFVRGGSSLELSMSYEIRQESFEKLQRLSFSYYDKTSVGYIMARVMSDTSRLSEMIAWSIVDVLYGLTFIIGCIITMFTERQACPYHSVRDTRNDSSCDILQEQDTQTVQTCEKDKLAYHEFIQRGHHGSHDDKDSR